MGQPKNRVILTSALLGAMIGLAAGVILAESKKEQIMLAESKGQMAQITPGFRDWISVAVAAVALVRQVANMFTPQVD